MFVALYMQLHHRVHGNFLVLVTVICAEKPDASLLIDFQRMHGAYTARPTTIHRCAKETGFCLLHHFLDPGDRLHPCQIAVMMFRFMSASGTHDHSFADLCIEWKF